jgi:hypothetical protein
MALNKVYLNKHNDPTLNLHVFLAQRDGLRRAVVMTGVLLALEEHTLRARLQPVPGVGYIGGRLIKRDDGG